ncbi:hypothetical protein [Cystobacter fuscus]|uniref:hypothetical protein n=1 Tax=Cystobacter fuscus TaxID=43 RepID=UPI0005BA08F9|nr:hypothetical protein [Cystobacter fuscus]
MGETIWLRHEALPGEDFAASVAASSDGQAIYTASMNGSMGGPHLAAGSGARFVLKRFSASGQVQWTREYPLVASAGTPPDDVWGRLFMSVGPTGDLYLLTEVHQGSVDLGSGPLSGLYVSRMSSSGELQWSGSFSSITERVLAVVASREDGVFVSVRATYPYAPERQCSLTEGAIYRIASSGAVVWRTRVGEPQCDGYGADVVSLAAQPGGAVALGGSFSGVLQTPIGSFSTSVTSPFFGTLYPDGRWNWLKAFSQSHGQVTSIGSSAKGTVVGAGVLFGGSFTWGNDSLGTVPSFLFVAESTGAPRWAKSLGRTERPVVAVEPAGRVVVAGLSRDFPTPAPGSTDPVQNPQLFARRFNLEGKLLWNRFFVRSGGPPNLFSEEVVSAAHSGEGNGNTLLFGHFSHTEDLGKGPLTPTGTDTFLLKLGPGPEF